LVEEQLAVSLGIWHLAFGIYARSIIAVLITVEEWAFQAHVKMQKEMGFSPGASRYTDSGTALAA
jgi:hypothetical protein